MSELNLLKNHHTKVIATARQNKNICTNRPQLFLAGFLKSNKHSEQKSK